MSGKIKKASLESLASGNQPSLRISEVLQPVPMHKAGLLSPASGRGSFQNPPEDKILHAPSISSSQPRKRRAV